MIVSSSELKGAVSSSELKGTVSSHQLNSKTNGLGLLTKSI